MNSIFLLREKISRNVKITYEQFDTKPDRVLIKSIQRADILNDPDVSVGTGCSLDIDGVADFGPDQRIPGKHQIQF